MKKVIIMCSIMFISGCSAIDTIKLTASHAVNKYCSVSEVGRNALRRGLNESLAPHSIKVTCGE